jgi:hypothetical protein
MELDRAVLGDVASLGKNTERLQDAYGARAVIVSAWSREKREAVVHRVLVSAEDGQGRGEVGDFGLKTCNDGWLRERMSKDFKRDVSMERRISDDLEYLLAEWLCG